MGFLISRLTASPARRERGRVMENFPFSRADIVMLREMLKKLDKAVSNLKDHGDIRDLHFKVMSAHKAIADLADTAEDMLNSPQLERTRIFAGFWVSHDD